MNNHRGKRVLVIGAGASGLAAACEAAKNGASVTVLEAEKKPGRKLLRTGGGRCNLANEADPAGKYFGACPEFAEDVLRIFPLSSLLAWYRELGILTVSFDGWLYPASEQAQSVLRVLTDALSANHVKLKLGERVRKLARTKDGSFLVSTDSWQYRADAVILACGSPASLDGAATGSSYDLAVQAGLKLIPVRPALVPLLIADKPASPWEGTRVHAKAFLISENEILAGEFGQVQLLKDALSGIAIFNLSMRALASIRGGRQTRIRLDLAPSYKEEELRRFLAGRSGLAPEEQIRALIPEKLIPSVVRFSRQSDLSHALKCFDVRVTGSRPLSQAQAASGGVDVKDISPLTLEAEPCPGLFLTGEMLDVVGCCGGYNLQFAFTTGIVAGRAAALKADGAPLHRLLE